MSHVIPLTMVSNKHIKSCIVYIIFGKSVCFYNKIIMLIKIVDNMVAQTSL